MHILCCLQGVSLGAPTPQQSVTLTSNAYSLSEDSETAVLASVKSGVAHGKHSKCTCTYACHCSLCFRRFHTCQPCQNIRCTVQYATSRSCALHLLTLELLFGSQSYVMDICPLAMFVAIKEHDADPATCAGNSAHNACCSQVKCLVRCLLFTSEVLVYCTDILQSQVAMFCVVLASIKTC